MKRLILIPAAAVLLTVGAASPALASTTFGTGRVTGSGTASTGSGPQLLQVSVGHHAGFDRVVFRFSGGVPGYDVRYVRRVIADPSGQPVALRGNAFIAVTLHGVASSNVGNPPAPQGRQRPGFPELREVAGAGDFEGVVSFGLGLRARTGFRAFTLTGPARLVVDVRIPAGASGAQSSSGGQAGTTAGGASAPRLANTGANAGVGVGGVAVVGSALLLLGGAARAVARRRRPAEA